MAGPAVGEQHVRVRSLDALRGIAASAVVLFHITTGFDQEQFFPGYESSWFQFELGRYGVQLFFVISGFVILWSLRRVEGLGQFAGGRFSRLYPPYWGSLLFVTAYIWIVDRFVVALPQLDFSWVQFLANLTMVPQWFGQKELDGVYWTLAIEMAFYILAGFLFWVGLTKRTRIVKTLVVIYAITLLVGLANSFSSSGGTSNNYLHFFVSGMALFTLLDEPGKDKWIKTALVFGAPIVEAAQRQEGATLVSIVIVTLMYLAVHGRLNFLENRPLLWLGSISYSLYLMHAFPSYITMKLLLDEGLDRQLVNLIAIAQSVLLAVILHKLVEKPVTRWLKVRWGLGRPRHRVSPT
jgi:peptidoglycan/LPS O-acetylase OafA/YrhL